jgi:hypothetical protein
LRITLGRNDTVKKAQIATLVFVSTMSIVSPIGAQDAIKTETNLEVALFDADQQWMCTGPYHKAKPMDCVEFRRTYWPETFFETEVQPTETKVVRTKTDMLAVQTAAAKAHPEYAPGAGTVVSDFKLRAVYGNVAMATDLTAITVLGDDGRLVTHRSSCLRVFVKQNDVWRPATASCKRLAE